MGQYYKFKNIDKKEEPKEERGFAKLTEHSYLGNNYCKSVLQLLSNEWKGDRILHIGDYAEDGVGANTDELINQIKNNEDIANIYDSDYKCVKSHYDMQKIRYVYNHDKKEYIDLYMQPIQWCYIDGNELGVVKFNSFALLSACGNGLGGGDYPSYCVNSDKIGSWAGDHFTSSSDLLNEYSDYTKNTYIFNEMNENLCKLIEENSGNKNYTIMNWNTYTNNTIINCGMDLIENTLANYKNEINFSSLRLNNEGITKDEEPYYKYTLEKFLNTQAERLNDIEM